MHRRALRLALGRLFVVAVVLACASSTIGYVKDQIPGWRSYGRFVRGLNALVLAPRSGEETDTVLCVPYRGATFSVVVPVDTGYLAAARRVDGSALFGTDPGVRAAALRTLFVEQRGDPFVSAMAQRLGALRTRLGLSDDDYVDFVTRAVQAIPYGTLHESTFMPAVTVADHTGVCADKSVLLACLLAHEGYDAGVFVFPSQAHAAVAIRGLGPGLHSTGYSLIETTRLSYVGEVDQSLRGAGPVFQLPQLVLAGGATRYRRDGESEFIAETLHRLRTPRRTAVLADADPRIESASKGAEIPAVARPDNRWAAWIDRHRDWPEETYSALVAAGPNR